MEKSHYSNGVAGDGIMKKKRNEPKDPNLYKPGMGLTSYDEAWCFKTQEGWFNGYPTLDEHCGDFKITPWGAKPSEKSVAEYFGMTKPEVKNLSVGTVIVPLTDFDPSVPATRREGKNYEIIRITSDKTPRVFIDEEVKKAYKKK